MTNGQQTLGVGLPWAIAACLVRPSEKVISISGDGGFLFSAMELETAVRLKCNLVHLVWIDGTYDMVGFQAVAKYGRTSGVDFGPVDVVRFAEAFGAKRLRIETPDQISSIIQKALAMQGPVIIGVTVDYRDNHQFMEIVHPKPSAVVSLIPNFDLVAIRIGDISIGVARTEFAPPKQLAAGALRFLDGSVDVLGRNQAEAKVRNTA
jgi:thiamine pyrophosphate-dependent acetolactate synthase large subunit-like protein